MGLFQTIRSMFHDDWCPQCKTPMELTHKQLYALPTMYVGHYQGHDDADYYKKHLVPVEKKAQIPTGMYACGIYVYRCPACGHRTVKLMTFLPVRDQEKMEQNLYFQDGEMDDFIF